MLSIVYKINEPMLTFLPSFSIFFQTLSRVYWYSSKTRYYFNTLEKKKQSVLGKVEKNTDKSNYNVITRNTLSQNSNNGV